jgi:dCTP deaminase
MTLLQREALREALSNATPIDKRLFVTPLVDQRQVGPASIDLRLGSEFFLLRSSREAGLDPAEDSQEKVEALHEPIRLSLGEKLWLHPGHFALGCSFEYVRLPSGMGAYVLGRSSWGRVGLIVATAIMVQPGYAGVLTLELVNESESPIALYPGLRIAQLAVHQLDGETAEPYGSESPKYSSPVGPQATRLAWDRREMDHIKRLGRRLSHPDPV